MSNKKAKTEAFAIYTMIMNVYKKLIYAGHTHDEAINKIKQAIYVDQIKTDNSK